MAPSRTPDRRPPADPAADTDPTDGGPLRPPPADPLDRPSPPKLDAGSTLAHYTIRRRLGLGGMGAVYLAWDGQLRRYVALKVMHPRLAADPECGERFLREARAAAAVVHDNVVTVHQVGVDAGIPFIAMQCLQGTPLDQHLKAHGVLPPGEVIRIARESAAGLGAAHALGLIHRDVKPGNIFLEAPTGRVKLLDFGLAKPADPAEVALTAAGMVVGTPQYMAPEQAAGKPIDHRADLFSLGCVLYELLTGRPAFDGPTTMAVLTALAVEHPPRVTERNPLVPPELATLIDRLLAKDPRSRPASAAELIADLDRLERELAARGVAAPGPATDAFAPSAARPAAGPSPTDLMAAAVSFPPTPRDAPTVPNSGGTPGPTNPAPTAPTTPAPPPATLPSSGRKRKRKSRRRPPPASRLPLILGVVGGFALAALVVVGVLVAANWGDRNPDGPGLKGGPGTDGRPKPWEEVRPDWWPADAPAPPWWKPGSPLPSRQPEWWREGMKLPPPPPGWKEGDEWPQHPPPPDGRPPEGGPRRGGPPRGPMGAADDPAGKPVKVFLLAGESNMAGKGHVRTLDWLGKDPKYGWLLGRLKNPDGKGWAARDDVWVFSHNQEKSKSPAEVKYGNLQPGFGAGKDRIGPELVFGHAMGDHFDNQVLLVKITQGELALAAEGRPPGSGGPAGEYYRALVGLLRQTLDKLPVLFPGYGGRGFELAGFVWFQGFNDSLDPLRAAQYEENLANLIRDLRRNLATPNLPVVVGETGIDGDDPSPSIAVIRKAQAAVAARREFAGNVALAKTADLWDREAAALVKKGWDPHSRKWTDPDLEKRFDAMGSDEAYHYLGSGKIFALIGHRMGEEMKKLLPK